MHLSFEEQPSSRLGSAKAQRQPGSPPAMEDLIPHSGKEQKHLRALWEEAQRHRETVFSYKNIYVAAVAQILAGWVLWGVDSPSSQQWGGILMLAGGLIGAFFSLKSLRRERLSAKQG